MTKADGKQVEHTAGPWCYKQDNIDAPYSILKANETGGTIADIFGDSMLNARANARLIAVAPELLKALLLARSWMPSTGEGITDIKAQIDSAISKATKGA